MTCEWLVVGIRTQNSESEYLIRLDSDTMLNNQFSRKEEDV